MEIINKELVDKFIERHANSGKALNRWVENMENATFKTHNELKLITICFIGTHAEYDKINCLTVLQ